MQHCSGGPNPFHFFKIILPTNDNPKKLKIPPKFVSIFGDELTTSATLTTPAGRVWPVRLEKAGDNDSWFCNGWQEFAEHNSVHDGYFLVFEYQGSSNFRVKIFDLTACEIKYPGNPASRCEEPYHGKQCSVHLEEGMEDDVSVKILGSLAPCEGPTSPSELISCECAGGQTKCRPYSPLVLQNLVKRSFDHDLGIMNHGKSDAGSKKIKMENHVDTTRVDYLNKLSHQMVNSHESKHKNSHPSLLDMAKTNNGNQTLSAENLQAPAKSVGAMSLQLSGRKLKNSPRTAALGKANRATDFDEDNSLTKHANEEEVIRSTTDDLSPSRHVTTRSRERSTSAARMFKPENPYFKAILKQYNFDKRFLNLPAEFARTHFILGSSLEIQDSAGRLWPVACCKSAKLSRGWPEFAADKNLKRGDVCIFELIRTKNIVLKVTIFRDV